MMVAFGEGRQRSWELSINAALNDTSAPSSLGLSTETDVISPLTPVVRREPFSTPGTYGTTARQRGDSFPSTVGDISPLDSSESWNDGLWSDATTAGAVLSLLHKEPPDSLSRTAHIGEQTRRISRITCSVCLETLEPDRYPETPIAAGCDHTSISGTHLCTICLSRSLDTQFSISRSALLACPLCHAQLSDEEVERWASTPTFLAYDMARTWRILEQDVEFVTCINPDCSSGQLHAGGLENPVVVCRACGTRTCFNHRTAPWHDGLTCAQYEIRSANSPTAINDNWTARPVDVQRVGNARQEQPVSDEILSRRTIQETTRACPECHAATERAGGCKHMRCMYSLSETRPASSANGVIIS